MTTQSETPRTDAMTGDHNTFYDVQFVTADFARQLEREVTALTAQLAEARREIERYREIHTLSGFEGNLLVRMTIRKHGQVHNNQQILRDYDYPIIGDVTQMMLRKLNAHIAEYAAMKEPK